MLKHYLKVAFRNIRRYKGYSLLNIFGLSIGMTSCLLILYFVNYEKSYDRFHKYNDRIYRLRYERCDQAGGAVKFASCCPPAGLRIRQKFPEVEKVVRLFRFKASVSNRDNKLLSQPENKFIEERMYFAEPDFFEIFKYPFIDGDPVNGIKEPNTTFISESTARKYFGSQNPMGQILSVDKKTSYRVNGIFKDIPANSHLKFDILLSYQNLLQKFGKEVEDSWGDSGWYTYLLLKPHADIKSLKKKLAALVETEFGEELKYYKLTCELPLQPLNDIHLTSNYMLEFEVNGDRDTVNFLSILSVFIIVIAWVNYINLSTARALTRAKEVELRKVSGASRSQLMSQFFFETLILNLFAVVFALFLVIIFLPLFRQITGTPVVYGIWSQTWFWLIVLLMFLAGIVLSGLYPVIMFSSFKPVSVLKGKPGNGARGINLRKGLIVFQFVIALGMLISTFTVFRQLQFMKNQDLGFSPDNKLIIRAPRVRDVSFASRLQTFKEALLKNPAIINFSVATDVPGKQVWWDAGGITRKGANDNKNYQIVGIDYEYVKLFDLKFVSGRNFSKEFPSDSSALILNETASQWLGFPNSGAAIGQQVDYWGKMYTVVGVMKDFHQQSVKQAFEPHIFRFMPTGRDVRGLFVLKINAQNTSSNLSEIKKQFDEFFPGNPFEYYFLDEYYNQQ
ncbi:MAG: ABC transporter permease, partial [Bacteroidota bacterium]